VSEVKESASAFSFMNERRSKLACDISAPATKKNPSTARLGDFSYAAANPAN
jgi:hypothetical protein